MALVVADRVKETTATTGTGTVSLAGAPTGFQTFVAGVGNSNTTYYAIVDAATGAFEIGIGTVTDGTPDTLARTTILESSNSDNAVNFGSGSKDVFCTQPAGKAVYLDASGNVSIPTGDLTIGSGQADGVILELSNTDSVSNGLQIQLSGNGKDVYFWNYENAATAFATNNIQRMTISSGGDVLFGTTDTSPANNSANGTADNGTVIGGGLVMSAAYKSSAGAGSVGYFNRTGTDGDIVQLFKSGVAVGSIGTRDSGALEIGSGDVYLQFNGANDWIKPVDGSGSNKSGVDLGTSGAQFDNLYLSGNVTVGGTVDGRDVATDGTKLDGIATGATNTVGNATHTGEVTGSGALTIANDVVDAGNLKVTGNGTTSQYLRSDADGTFTWATPPDTNTTYSVGDGGLSQINFTSADHTKLNGIATGATDNTVANAALPKAGGTVTGDVQFNTGANIHRGTFSSGYLVGGHNNIGSTGAKTNPIYTIGTNYQPTDTSLSNMYGIGFAAGGSHPISSIASMLGSGWGLYVVADGDARIGLDATTGSIRLTGTVDGRDVAADGTKLDGIAASANNYSFPYTVSASNSNSTVVQRTSAGYIFSQYFNGSGSFSTSGATSGMGIFTGTNGSDTYARSYTAAAARTLLNVENGATADQSAAEIQTAMAPVIESGSTIARWRHSNGENIVYGNINSYTYLYFNNIWEERMASGYAEGANSYRTHTFYDIDNTAYYTNPAATSVMNDIYLEGQIYHNGDTNTYHEFHAADQWRVVTGGTERFEINNNDINCQANIQMLSHYLHMNNNSIQGIDQLVAEGDTNTYVRFHAADQFQVVTGGTERVEVNNTNTTVANNLIVSGSATFNGAVSGVSSPSFQIAGFSSANIRYSSYQIFPFSGFAAAETLYVHVSTAFSNGNARSGEFLLYDISTDLSITDAWGGNAIPTYYTTPTVNAINTSVGLIDHGATGASGVGGADDFAANGADLHFMNGPSGWLIINPSSTAIRIGLINTHPSLNITTMLTVFKKY